MLVERIESRVQWRNVPKLLTIEDVYGLRFYFDIFHATVVGQFDDLVFVIQMMSHDKRILGWNFTGEGEFCV